MPALSFLIKPASSACNMKCTYCFYSAVAQHRSQDFLGMMPEYIAELLVKSALGEAEQSCSFCFQGGEPTLRGLDFFRYFVACAERYNDKRLKIEYAIQTNGLLIDEEWCEFFAEKDFLVGLSLDGPAELHNSHRITQEGKGSHSAALRAARLLKKHGVSYNLLCVVTKNAARGMSKVYSFLKGVGSYLQFIPCLEPLEEERLSNPYALDNDAYLKYLISSFDVWFSGLERGEYISVRHIDNLMNMLAGGDAECCSMRGACSVQYVVEGDGSVYPCDFYVYDEYRIGRVGGESFAAMADSRAARDFVEGSRSILEECRACHYFGLCRNGCRRDRTDGKTTYCAAWKAFFDARLPRMAEARAILRRLAGRKI